MTIGPSTDAETLWHVVLLMCGKLSNFSRKQFLSAWSQHPRFSEKRNGLWNHYMSGRLLDQEQNWHICLSGQPDYAARRHIHTLNLLRSNLVDYEIQEKSPFFTNGLRIPEQDALLYGRDERGSPRWGPAPKDRTANVGFVAITLEIDNDDPEVLEWQLSLLRSPDGKPQNSPLGRLIKRLNRFQDFRGVTVVYGGNKSLHFHFIFDTRHLSRALCEGKRHLLDRWQGDVPDASLRCLHEIAWLRLVSEFKQVIPCAEPFDPQLKLWEQFRRTPWGIRIAPDNHLLGVPSGVPVPQLVLFETLRVRAPNNAGESSRC